MQVTNPEHLTALSKDIHDYLEYLRAERKASTNTVNAYANDLHDFVTFAAQLPVQNYLDPTLEELAAYNEYLRGRHLKARSIVRKLQTLRGFYVYLEVEAKTTAPNMKKLVPPKYEKKLPTVLTKAMVVKLIEEPDQRDRYAFRDRALMEFLYATGCRVSEAISVQCGDLDFEELTCRVFGKGNKERFVPFHFACASALKLYLQAERPYLARGSSKQHLFLSSRGQPLTRELVFVLIRKYAERANIAKSVHPHVLRHTLATHLVAGGADIRVVQEVLGHASLNSTQIYVSVDAARLKEVHAAYHPRGKVEPEPLTDEMTGLFFGKLDLLLEEPPDPIPAAVSPEKPIEVNGVLHAEARE